MQAGSAVKVSQPLSCLEEEREMQLTERTRLPAMVLILVVLTSASFPQSTSFSYQGHFTDNSQPANGSYDFEFALFDASEGGSQVGGTVTRTGVQVIDGNFSVTIDFGGEFPGAARYLEIRVSPSAAADSEQLGGMTTLAPRQPILSVPYAIKSSMADTASTAANAENLGGVAPGQYVVTTDPRLTDSRTPTSGSADYIQNTMAQQSSSNFNVSGTGKADKFDAATQYEIGGSIVLTIAGTDNTFVGIRAGESNTGAANSFVGKTAGSGNTTGSFNSFFGVSAGNSNAAGNHNSIFGVSAGRNTFGDSNSFFGAGAGFINTTGSLNTLLGFEADFGANNLTNATAIGANAQVSQSNSLVLGSIAGINGAAASTNVGIGTDAPLERLHVAGNGLFTGNLAINGTFSGAIDPSSITSVPAESIVGTLAIANGGTGLSSVGGWGTYLRFDGSALTISQIQFDDIPAGSDYYIQNRTTAQGGADFNIDGTGKADRFEANTMDAAAQFSISGVHALSAAGTNNIFVGNGAGGGNTTGSENSFAGKDSGLSNTSGSGNSFFGNAAGNANTVGGNNSAFGNGAGFSAADLSYATVIGAGAIGTQSDTIQLGRNLIDVVKIGDLASVGASLTLCRINPTQASPGFTISYCSSSVRYKTDIHDFSKGLDLISRLRPVSFSWKEGRIPDIGLIAEEVDQVEPRLTTRNSKGEIEGVKYDRVGVILVGAVKEQQLEIERLREQLGSEKAKAAAMELRLKVLEEAVCSIKPEMDICKSPDSTEN